MFQYNKIDLTWTGHAGFKILHSDIRVYIDPYKLSKKYEKVFDANFVLITHNHFDHLSIEDLNNIMNEGTIIVAAQECIAQLKPLKIKELIGMDPHDSLKLKDLLIETIPAYNINKDFHPKNDKKIGFMIEINNNKIYHTGDSDIIPEMKETNPSIVLIPVSGTYVMTAEEASRAVNELITPKVAVPMHYGTIIGNQRDAIRFSELVTVCTTKILESE